MSVDFKGFLDHCLEIALGFGVRNEQVRLAVRGEGHGFARVRRQILPDFRNGVVRGDTRAREKLRAAQQRERGAEVDVLGADAVFIEAHVAAVVVARLDIAPVPEIGGQPLQRGARERPAAVRRDGPDTTG